MRRHLAAGLLVLAAATSTTATSAVAQTYCDAFALTIERYETLIQQTTDPALRNRYRAKIDQIEDYAARHGCDV
jgi:hypothetical protein